MRLFIAAVLSSMCVMACSPSSTDLASTDRVDDKGVDILASDQSTVLQSSLPTLSGDHIWVVDYANSHIKFTGQQEGRLFEGEFKNFAAAISLDPAYPETGEIYAVVDMGSVDAGSRNRNDSLPGAEWFHTSKFPQAIFESKDIQRDQVGGFKAVGPLTVKGISQTIALPFILGIRGDQAFAQGKISLDRSAFNVGEGEYASDNWIDFNVDVKIEIIAIRTP